METYRATSETIACTLSPAELRDTQAAWQKLFRLSLISRQVVPGGLRLVVHEGSAEALGGWLKSSETAAPGLHSSSTAPR